MNVPFDPAFLTTPLATGLLLLLDAAVKGTLILVAAWLMCLALRRASAASRHLVWNVALCSLLALPVIGLLLPVWPIPLLLAEGTAVAQTVAVENQVASAEVPVPAPSQPAPTQPLAAAASQTPSEGRNVPITPVVSYPAAESVAGEVPEPQTRSPHWSAWLMLLWGLGALLTLLPLLIGLVRVVWLTRQAARMADPSWISLLQSLAGQLGLRRAVTLLQSERASMPMTWGLVRSVVLLPAAANHWPAERRRVVLMHELAHIQRRDCLSQLFAHLAWALYWFHPLVWLAVRRLRVERERACDDRVLRAGAKASDYAWHLLEIARSFRATRCTAAAAVAMARPSQLEGRLLAILDGARSRAALSPRVALLAWVAAMAMLLPVATVRLEAKAADAKAEAKPDVPDNKPHTMDKVSDTLTGRVQDASGKPVAGAAVYWVGVGAKELHLGVAMPKAMERELRQILLAQGKTDDTGRFSLTAEFQADDKTPTFVVVQTAGMGLAGKYHVRDGSRAVDEKRLALLIAELDSNQFAVRESATKELEKLGELAASACRKALEQKPSAEARRRLEALIEKQNRDWQNLSAEVELTVWPEIKIEGQFLTPSGTPAKGVRVQLRSVSRSAEEEGIGAPSDSTPLPYWPKAVLTDDQGRFTLGGLSKGATANLRVTHDDFAQENLTVDAGSGFSHMFATFEMRPLKPKFKYTLQPGRPVRGVITAADTGKPLAGAIVEVTVWGRHGGHPFPTHTDDQGRYRVSGSRPDNAMFQYTITVYPPPGSGYLSMNDWHNDGWPAGAKFLEKNFKLSKGRVISGSVMDGDTGKPIAGASVIYQPKSDNPRNRGNLDLRNPVLTDKQGHFALTGLAGEGVVVAEGASSDYIRVTLPKGETIWSHDLFPHGYAKVNIPEKGEPAAVTITLRKGVTIEARVLQPDGKPVPFVYAGARELNVRQIERWSTGERFEKGKFRMRGCDPSRTYRVFFVQPDLGLGAVAELKYDPKAAGVPVEVRLQPTASVRGRVVTADGAPAPQAQVYPLMLLTKEEGVLKRDDFFSEDRMIIYVNLAMGSTKFQALLGNKPNAKGEFLLQCLIPDVKFYITAGTRQQESVRQSVTLKPGEVKDIGVLTLRKEQMP